MRARLTLLMIFVVTCRLAARQAAPPSSAPPRLELLAEAESSLIADGWAALAKSDLAGASQRVAELRSRDPRSALAMLLGVEVDIAREGALGALRGYEGWLAGRTLDDPIALRRIARALLFEVARGADPSARVEALSALSAAGEPAALAALVAAAGTGSIAETRALAAAGNAAAIARLSEELDPRYPAPNKIAIVESLVKSGSPQAIAPLVVMLQDQRPEHRAAAADGLGRLGVVAQIPALRALLENQSSTPVERVAAAGALLRLNDTSGYTRLLDGLRSDVPGVRAAAAKALEPRQDAAWLSVVRELARDPDPGIRLDAVKLLAPYDRDNASAAAERMMSDQNIGVREEAVRIFATQVASDFATLRGLLRSPDAVVRAIAGRRILELTR